MNKKGGHVDWVISMGIFITYIFALFILLRPGIKPIHRPESLLNSLQNNFEDDVGWTVKMVPLFVEYCGGVLDGFVPSVGVEDEGGGWSTSNSKLICDGTLNFIEAGKYIPFDFYFYPKSKDSKSISSEFAADCSPDDPDFCIAEIGVAESIEGISPRWLGEIRSNNIEDYKSLKENWDVPPDKDFSIFEDNEEIIGAEPYEMANVFVRRIETQEVTRGGKKTPVTIYLKIW